MNLNNVPPLRSQLQLLPRWKSTTQMYNVAAPMNHPPVNTTNQTSNGPDFKARPIQHWRKRLNTRTCTYAGKGSYANFSIPMDRPGGSIVVGDDVGCSPLKANISPNDCPSCRPGNKTIRIRSGMTNARVRGNPGETTTTINNIYASNTEQYLHKRCLTYKQRLVGQPIDGVDYTLPPSDSSTGSQVRSTNYCVNDGSSETNAGCNRMIYKPSNTQFAVQGSVDSSSRTLRLKYNTITKNAKSFTTAYDRNSGLYNGSSAAPYFIKTKTNICKPSDYQRNGNKNLKCSAST